ncbi:protein pangolin, isoforms A/H/I/S-like [Ctenocephalides felis]|uniref:protein pangolin, isoforms A/H/I/S-like n=1 Tax=Ctenocephalides felis TaxID=7515 RepID=UPI000E6E1119|nr:protein pangolin, isoforms A/H/I/S-like [Ctenocephalides felis]
MPHAHSASGGDDLGSTDEVKVFYVEGDGEDEKRSSENLLEEKSSLIDLTESEEKSATGYTANKNASRSDHSPVFGKFYDAQYDFVPFVRLFVIRLQTFIII